MEIFFTKIGNELVDHVPHVLTILGGVILLIVSLVFIDRLKKLRDQVSVSHPVLGNIAGHIHTIMPLVGLGLLVFGLYKWVEDPVQKLQKTIEADRKNIELLQQKVSDLQLRINGKIPFTRYVDLKFPDPDDVLINGDVWAEVIYNIQKERRIFTQVNPESGITDLQFIKVENILPGDTLMLKVFSGNKPSNPTELASTKNPEYCWISSPRRIVDFDIGELTFLNGAEAKKKCTISRK